MPLLTAHATKSDPARVITTASVAGIGIGTTGQSSTPSYSASKAAVIHLTKNLAVELGPKNVRCNAIAPGFYVTRMVSLFHQWSLLLKVDGMNGYEGITSWLQLALCLSIRLKVAQSQVAIPIPPSNHLPYSLS